MAKTAKSLKNVNGVYFQPNKHKTGDCSVRSICAAINVDWLDSFNLLVEKGIKFRTMPNDVKCIDSVLSDNNFVGVCKKLKRGEKRQTVNEFCKEHKKGIYVLRVCHHVVTVKNGKFYDIWDCGNEKIFKYWEKI